MKFFGIVRSAANLLVSRYVDNALKTPNLDEAGNVGVNVVFSGGGGPFVIPFQTDDGSVPTGLVAPVYIPLNYGFNSGTGAWERNAKIIANTDDGTIPSAQLLQTMLGLGYAFNGTDWVRLHNGSEANLSAAQQNNALITTLPGMWSQTSNPGFALQATTTRAAVAAQRHVITAITFSLTGAVVTESAVNLIGSGASGTVFSINIRHNVQIQGTFGLSGLNIVFAVNESVTLSFPAAIGTNQQSVTLMGYTV